MSHVFNSESCLFKLSVASTPWRMSLQWVMSLIMSHVSYSESCLFKLSIASTSWRMSLQWVMSRERHWPAAVELNKAALIRSHACHHLWDVGVRIYTMMCVCVCVFVWVCMNEWIIVCVFVRVLVCVCVCVCVCMYKWVDDFQMYYYTLDKMRTYLSPVLFVSPRVCNTLSVTL